MPLKSVKNIGERKQKIIFSSKKCKKEEEMERTWKYYQQADNLHSGRINFFLVAESMLLVSFIATTSIFIKTCIGVLGIVYTSSWLHVNIRLVNRMAVLKESLKELDEIYKKYLDAVSGIPDKVILTYVLPISTLLLWLIFVIYVICTKPQN
ncbi:MAG: hypothetical protein WA277_05620 [Nitrospirota bacterium]